MKEVISFECEKCGAKYPERLHAIDCEQRHISYKSSHVDNIREYYYAGDPIPYKIEIVEILPNGNEHVHAYRYDEED
jgi:hypothetical protein